MPLRLVTPPAVEPVTLAEAKAHLRVDISDDDSLIQMLIVAARQHGESITNRQFITATYEVSFDAWPLTGRCRFELPRPSLLAVSSVTYMDTNGSVQTLDPTVYQVDALSDPGRVFLAYGQAWPSVRSQPNAITIRYTCGFGPAESNVPEAIRQWLLVRVATLYTNRSQVVMSSRQQLHELPRDFVDCLLDAYTIPVVA